MWNSRVIFVAGYGAQALEDGKTEDAAIGGSRTGAMEM